VLEKYPFMDCSRDDGPNEYFEDWLAGWQEAVGAFWAEVSTKLNT